MGRVTMSHMANVKATDMQMRKTSDDRDQAKDQTYTETDEIEGVHIIWCSV